MPRGTKPGAKRGPYRAHSRIRKATPEIVAAIRAAETLADAYKLALPAGLALCTIAAIRRGTRKPPLPPA